MSLRFGAVLLVGAVLLLVTTGASSLYNRPRLDGAGGVSNNDQIISTTFETIASKAAATFDSIRGASVTRSRVLPAATDLAGSTVASAQAVADGALTTLWNGFNTYVLSPLKSLVSVCQHAFATASGLILGPQECSK